MVKQVNIRLTAKCNYKCGICPFHGKGYSGDFFKEREDINIDMPLEKALLLLAKVRDEGFQVVNLTPNGEFFMYPHWKAILQTAKKLKMKVSITTNGGLLSEDIIREVCRIGVSHITVSIDSVVENHYKSLRTPANSNTYRNAVNAPVYFKKYGGSNVYVQVQCVEQDRYDEEKKQILAHYENAELNQISFSKVISANEHGTAIQGAAKGKKISDANSTVVENKAKMCANFGAPILMPNGLLLGCCGMFYFYNRLDGLKQYCSATHNTVKGGTDHLLELYDSSKIFREFCNTCQLYEDRCDKIENKFISGKYFCVKSKRYERYFPIPRKISTLPRELQLFLYKTNGVKQLKKLKVI
ncbi:radical SAM protein [Desulfurispira natronophila]|uniref:MoaA/NifB/PqqE/SkfB family radical SAM enzyme n=1 Tax=Desulfurispira natronophila TaxID=682562 RepID=A0A7W7Y4I5_9BACT|nr:radical SAM protein [Desulfurispira natronophila]MBB5021958.1 MoaA/NifB/PqqE/SkfB family radical SAM enzyme [Desulfurispira natronophila]